MVSTRGVKFKFSEGEKVLCYEPDPTKAKVLYDSKVLEVCVSKDSRKRKLVEYLIHFSGWSNTWDRCVSEEFILKDNDENRALQKRLAEAAAVHLRTKKKRRRLPEMFRESLNKKKCTDVEVEDWKVSGESNTSHSAASSTVTGSEDEEEDDKEDDEDEEEEEKLIELEIPEALKKQLEIDFYTVKKDKKLVKLPRELNVIKILEGYVKTHATNVLCASTGKAKISKKQASVGKNINLCKEVMDGLRIYFDFTLPLILLFEEEKAQYDYFIKNYRPQCELSDSSVVQKEESTGSNNEQSLNVSGGSSTPATVSVESTVSSPLLLTINNDDMPLSPSSELSPLSTKSSSHRVSRRDRLELFEYPKRVLRSSVNRHETSAKCSSSTAECMKNEAGSSADDEQLKSGGSKEEKTPKATRVLPTRQAHSTVAKPFVKSTASSPLHGPSSSLSPASVHTVDSTLSQRVQAPPPLNIPSHISSMSSSSSRSGPSTPTMKTCQVEVNSALQEAMSWCMIPSYVYQQTPPPPSLIYGAQHLLRLFVKLPEMIKRTNMAERKLDALLIHLTAFLNYLEMHKGDFFNMSDYEMVPEEFKLESNTTDSAVDNSVVIQR